MIAKIAVSGVPFAIDQPYSYKIPEDMPAEPGMRVRVPFGRSNKRCEGIILQLTGEPEEGCKSIESMLDEQPVVSDEQLRLAAFIRERYFCTYYEAIHAILPAGFWFETSEIWTLSPQAAKTALPNEAAKQLVQCLLDLGGSAEGKLLRQLLEASVLQEAAAWLKKKKLLSVSTDLSQRASVKTEKTAELTAPCEEAMDFARRKKRSAPLQSAVLELLCGVGGGSCQEICYLTGASMTTLKRLEALHLLKLGQREVLRTAVRLPSGPAGPVLLSSEQKTAFDGLYAQAMQEKPGAALLYGVTGSGKTSVYIALIDALLQQGKTALLLVPEIALTPQLLGKLTAHFGKQVAVLHSSLPVGERFDEWRRIQRGDARVVVGARSAVFAPIHNPGVIILDEEQEHTYKSENAPRYHAREIALYRGTKSGCLVLFGSATPSVETMYHAKNGDYALYTLKERYNGQSLPRVEIVDFKQELRQGNTTSISRLLEESIRDNVLEDKQSILFLNRRGNSRYLVCVECGEAPECPRCSVHLTYHSANSRLMCHYCGYSEPVYQKCRYCGGALKPIGVGTQKIEEELHALFPDTGVLRMDADTVTASNSHEAILNRFREEKIPVLLGTQMVAKGLDFDGVTLVGVVDADMSLYTDSYRAAETTFSLITQVVGRAGRGSSEGRAVIQTMVPEHPVILLASRQDYDAFYDMEIELRRLRYFPPFGDFFTVTFTGTEEQRVAFGARFFRDSLDGILRTEPYSQLRTLLLGPAPAPVVKVNYQYRYRLTLGCKNSRQIRQLLAHLLCEFAKDKQMRGVSAYADFNTYE